MPNATHTADFGPRRSGLATVAYRVGSGPWLTAGVSEYVPGAGIYSVSIYDPPSPTYLLWTSGEAVPRHLIEDLNPASASSAFRSLDLGPRRSGLADVGYTLDGLPRVGAVPELLAGSGIYGIAVTPPAGYEGPITWDTGGTSPRYFEDSIGPLGLLAPAFAPTLGVRDQDVLDDVFARLDALGQFAGVHWAEPGERGFGSDEWAVAIVEPDGWDEIDQYDDQDGPDVTRTSTWRLVLVVRREDARDRRRELDRLANACCNALDGQSLAGLTLPGRTKLRRARYERAEPPEQRMTILGEYQVFVPSFAGHDADEAD